MTIMTYALIVFTIYLLIGAAFWALLDSDDLDLLKLADSQHELLSMFLLLLWPVFAWIYVTKSRPPSSPD